MFPFTSIFNISSVKLLYLKFHPIAVGKNHSYLVNIETKHLQILMFDTKFIPNNYQLPC